MARLVSTFLLLTTLLVTAAVADRASASTVAYIPPVSPFDSVVTDHFRAPSTPYAAGNRGVDYATVPGSPVVASAAGQVVFAGQVGGALHVTIAHDDGLRTSYSFLAVVLVAAGDHVDQGQPIGLTGSVFHFGVRDADGTYLDPEALLDGHLGAHLVPGPDEGADTLGSGPEGERRSLLGVVADQIADAVGLPAAALAHEAAALVPGVSAFRLVVELDQLRRSQQGCTPASLTVSKPAGRRIAVLVGGLGSTSRSAAVDRVDTAALGYAPGDVIRFSYAGGRVPSAGSSPGTLASAIPVTPYGALDTEGDLHQTGAQLADLIGWVAQAAPGVPIDVLAHSEGGVVTRLALDQAADERRLPPEVATAITISTPHQGADAATGLMAIEGSGTGQLAVHALAGPSGLGLDPDGVSLSQLSEVSSVTAELSHAPPPGVRVVSIGASGDLAVPWVRTLTPGATSVLIHHGGPSTHDELPSDPATTREIALAIAGRGPTCRPWLGAVDDVVTSHLIAQGEDELGLALATVPPP